MTLAWNAQRHPEPLQIFTSVLEDEAIEERRIEECWFGLRWIRQS